MKERIKAIGLWNGWGVVAFFWALHLVLMLGARRFDDAINPFVILLLVFNIGGLNRRVEQLERER